MNYYDILFARKLGGGGDIPPHSYQLKSIANTPTPIATFNASALPMPSLTVGIEAVQDLHGYDYPWVGGAGKNKFNCTATTQEAYGVTFTVNNDGTISTNGTATGTGAITIGSYTPTEASILNGCPSGGGGSSYLLRFVGDSTYSDTGSGVNIPVGNAGNVVIYVVNGSNMNGKVFKPMIRLASVQDTTFAPYSNICPISGWSAVNVVVSPTTDVEDGTTYTTALKDGQGNPMTCYGGQLSNVNGVQTLTADFKNADLSSLNWTKTDVEGNPCFYANLSDGKVASTFRGLCSTYKRTEDTTMSENGTIQFYGSERFGFSRVMIRDDNYASATASEFKSAVTGSIIYELATPQQIPQDSLSIATQEGTNNIWADSGDVLSGEYLEAL